MTCRVLIAEEEVECCQLFRMFLQRYGYEVTTVHDGMSCVEALQDRAPPDVLILSWELPWGEAEGVLDWLTAHGLDDMAVIVLTARMSTDPGPQEWSLQESRGCRDRFGSMNFCTPCSQRNVRLATVATGESKARRCSMGLVTFCPAGVSIGAHCRQP